MICFNCGRKLHSSGDEECRLCGVKFAFKCPVCKYPNPTMARYCFNCGKKVARSGTESSVQNYDTLSEGRRNVAVIFADVSGFTALSEKMDPEEIRDIINECFGFITKPVYEMEGTIDKYIGDCVMVLFGAKFVHSDDAGRAVICALKMLELVKEFSAERLSHKGYSLDLSIGINYGLVVTGSVGNYFDKDYTVMGDIVNTAQRLQSCADKGEILVSESVYNETKGMISYSKPREVVVKNKKSPVRCYTPVKIDSGYYFEGVSPFVARESEISELNSIYNEALNTGAKLIAVTGEAGIGKTRILKEFVSKLGNDVKVVWIDCSPMYQNRAYYVISNILMSVMNIGVEDNKSVKQRRLVSFLDYILRGLSGEEVRKNSSFLGLILGLERDNDFQNILDSMSFDSIKREIIKQLSLFFVNLCRKNKLLVIVDDVHWADDNSLDTLKEVIIHLSRCNAAFIFTARHETEGIKPHDRLKIHTLKLDAFEETAVKAYVCKLLDCREVDKNLLETILKFTNGNPLYIKEFILNIKRREKYYLKNGAAFAEITDEGQLPGNIRSLIMSNFSELDDTAKNFLQAASIIGKDFSLSFVNDLLGRSSDEEDMPVMPVKLNIISLKSVYTSEGAVDKIFTFNQDMQREAIYENILNKSKKELHRRAGELMEQKYAKDMDNYCEIVYTHFEKAGLIKKAAEYCYKTAVKFKNSFNFTSSLEYYGKYIEISRDGAEEDDKASIVDALKDMGRIYFVLSNYEKAYEYLNKALELAEFSEDVYSIKIMLAEIFKEQDLYDKALAVLKEIQPKIRQESNIYGKVLQMQCNILRLMCDPSALSIAKRSEKVLLKARDYDSLSETMNQAGIIYYTKGDIDNSLFYLNKSYKYAEKVDNLAVMAKVSGNLGIIYHATGMVSKALESFNRAIDTSRKICDQQGYAIGCINLGVLYMDKGLFKKAENLFNEALTISEETLSRLNECVCLTNLGDIMYERGENQKAIEFYKKSLELARSINVPIGEGINYLGFARVGLTLGNGDEIEEYLDNSYRIFEETGEVEYLSDYYRYMSLNQSRKGNKDEAFTLCEKSITCAKECRSDRKLIKAVRLKADLLVKSGQPEQALEYYDRSITLAEQLETDLEAARCLLGRYYALRVLEKYHEAKQNLHGAWEKISRVDSCKWTKVIEREISLNPD
jgi:adenylate cyclase